MAAATGLSTIVQNGAASSFVDDFGFAVADFFDDDWNEADLKNAMEGTVTHVCYAYGKFDQPKEVEASQDPGFLSRLQQVGLDDLRDNPKVYDWLLRYLDDISDLLEWLDVFPDRISTKVSEFAEKASDLTKYVPLVASTKGVLDSGCAIHEKLEAGKDPSEAAYIEFFKFVALTVVEVIALATGVGASYRVAFKSTGWVNRRLIHMVGHSIGWRAYSWVLSQIHWGIRIVFAEGIGQGINETVGEVSEAVILASSETQDPVSKSEAKEQVRTDVMAMAEQTDGRGWDYEIWEQKQQLKRRRENLEKRINELTGGSGI